MSNAEMSSITGWADYEAIKKERDELRAVSELSLADLALTIEWLEKFSHFGDPPDNVSRLINQLCNIRDHRATKRNEKLT